MNVNNEEHDCQPYIKYKLDGLKSVPFLTSLETL